MNRGTAVVRFYNCKTDRETDIDIPLDISANELVLALNQAYDLGIDVSDFKKCFLKAENPVALLKGNKTLSEFGIHSGSIIYTA